MSSMEISYLFDASERIPEPLATADGASSVLLSAWSEVNPTMAALVEHTDLRYGCPDPSRDWGKEAVTPETITEFGLPWTMTRAIWEDDRHAFWRGTWWQREQKFVLIPHEPPRSVVSRPPWSEVIFGARAFWQGVASDYLSSPAVLNRFSEFVVARNRLPVEAGPGAGPLHVDERDHTDSLVYLSEAASLAGVVRPPAALLAGADRATVRAFATKASADEVLLAHSMALNAAESAGKVLTARIRSAIAALPDVSGPPAPMEQRERELDAWDQSYGELSDMTDPANADRFFAAEMPKWGEDAPLPLDLPTLREVLTERLEAAATGRQKALKGGLSQQVVDLWAACGDMDDALQEVALECTRGTIAIRRAEDDIWVRVDGAWVLIDDPVNLPDDDDIAHEGDDPPDSAIGADRDHYRQLTGIPRAKAAFGAAKAKIEAVQAANIPIWRVGAKEYRNPNATHTVPGRAVTVDLEQPARVPESAVIHLSRVEYADGSDAPTRYVKFGQHPGQLAWHRAAIKLPATETRPVTVHLFGNNDCGDTKLTIVVTPPAS